MSGATQGDDRHAWETEYAVLEEDLRTEPFEALPELLDLVERMLDAAGFEERRPGAALETEVDVVLERTRDAVARFEAGLPVAGDDGFQAAAELREIYKALLDHPEAEAGADMRELGGDPVDRGL